MRKSIGRGYLDRLGNKMSLWSKEGRRLLSVFFAISSSEVNEGLTVDICCSRKLDPTLSPYSHHKWYPLRLPECHGILIRTIVDSRYPYLSLVLSDHLVSL
jgi:hypothetical protein